MSAKLIARRSLGLFRKRGLEELKASMRSPSPGLTNNRDWLIPYFRMRSSVGSRKTPEMHVAPVDLVAIDASEQLCGRAPSEVHVEAGEVHLPPSVVVGVATDDDALVLAVLLDVVGAGRGERASSLASKPAVRVGPRRSREASYARGSREPGA